MMEIFEMILGVHLNEILSPSEVNKLRDELAEPEILPCSFDVTIPGWLARIGKWGKVTIYHKDPENFRGKRRVTPQQMDRRLGDVGVNKMFGRWSVEKKSLTKVVFYRDYIGVSGRHYTEQFIVSVKLRKELR
jgi:hypothetical protein